MTIKDDKIEDLRLAALCAYDIMDTQPEHCFDRITQLAMQLFKVPIAIVSFIDKDRQWFKSRHGLEPKETPRSLSFCQFTIQQSEPLVIEDTRVDDRTRHNALVTGHPGIRFYAGAPLTTPQGFRLGSLAVIDTVPRKFASEQAKLLQQLSHIVVDQMELRSKTYHDIPTGALARRAFLETASIEALRALRHESQLSFLILEIDNLDAIIEKHDQDGARAALLRLVTTCQACLRASDLVGRLGNNQFGILLPETGEDAARLIGERLRLAVSKITEPGPKGPIRITASFGVADLSPNDDNIKRVIERADLALYLAQHRGGNRVVVSRDSGEGKRDGGPFAA